MDPSTPESIPQIGIFFIGLGLLSLFVAYFVLEKDNNKRMEGSDIGE